MYDFAPVGFERLPILVNPITIPEHLAIGGVIPSHQIEPVVPSSADPQLLNGFFERHPPQSTFDQPTLQTAYNVEPQERTMGGIFLLSSPVLGALLVLLQEVTIDSLPNRLSSL